MSEPTVNFIYRGNTYNYNYKKVKSLFPAQNTNKLVHKLMYRGVAYMSDPTTVPTKPIGCKLTYRWNTYQIN
jgi:hypothetical protein